MKSINESISIEHENAELQEEKPKNEKRPFLRHLHYFRGFAILNIVIVHTWQLSGSHIRNSAEDYLHYMGRAKEYLFHGSTLYFLFISGFLFHYLSHNFKIKEYYKKKLMYVVTPYILISSFILLSDVFYQQKHNVDYTSFFVELFDSLRRGSAQVQFWYIPFIIIVFLISPILLYIPEKPFTVLAVISLFIPLLGTRTGTEVTFWQFVYFLPVYILGMFTSMKYDYFKSRLEKVRYVLLAVFFLSTIAAPLIGAHHLSFMIEINVMESLVYIQKLSATFLILYLLLKYKRKDSKLLDMLATYSFPIFFLHVLVYFAFSNVLYSPEILQHIRGAMIIPYSIFCTGLILFLTLLICKGLKKILQNKSKYVMGA